MRCEIVGIEARSVEANQGIIPTIAHALARIVHRLRPINAILEEVPNLKPHQSEEAIEAVEGAGARVEPLPPWSPDLTPIEEMVSKVKGAMRSAGARTTNAVYWAFASALDQVTLNDIAGWFQSRAAYAMRL